MYSKQDNRGGNWFTRHKLLTAIGASTLVVASGTIIIKYIPPWVTYQQNIFSGARRSDLSTSEVRKYLEMLGLKWLGHLYIKGKNINFSTLELLVNDPDIIRKAKENRADMNLNEKIHSEIENLVMGRIGNTFLRDNFDPNEYHALRLNSELGIYTIVAAHMYDVNTPDLLKIPEPNENDFLLLKKEEIPVKYSVPKMRQGQKAKEIIEKYAMEMCGVSAEVRREYRSIKTPYGKRLANSQIKILASNEMIPDYLKDIVREKPELMWTALKLIQQGKLNGKIYDEWRPEVSVDDTLFGIEKGYNPEMVIRANLLGRSLRQFHQDLQYHLLIDEFLKDRNPQSQPMLNTAPR